MAVQVCAAEQNKAESNPGKHRGNQDFVGSWQVNYKIRVDVQHTVLLAKVSQIVTYIF